MTSRLVTVSASANIFEKKRIGLLPIKSSVGANECNGISDYCYTPTPVTMTTKNRKIHNNVDDTQFPSNCS